MARLLVIADDFTGALDTGIQFHAKDTRVLIGSDSYQEMAAAADQAQVLVMDAETRHMTPEEAGKTVSRIVQEAVRLQIPYIFKKTDSALRGNIGSELAAALKESGSQQLHFVPAFPVMGRTTLHGIHRINGVPAAQSAFRNDPFNPVTASYVPDIIRNQADIPVCVKEKGVPAPDGASGCGKPAGENADGAGKAASGIIVHDAETDEDLRRIAEELAQKQELGLLAGCAGFASVIPELIGIVRDEKRAIRKGEGFFFLCGSVNPATIRQVDYAAGRGFEVLSLTNRQKLGMCWEEDGLPSSEAADMMARIQEGKPFIIESFSDQERVSFPAFAADQGLSTEEVRSAISEGLGKLLKALIGLGLHRTFMISGGDTLLAFMRAIGGRQLEPVCELKPGVVLSRTAYRGKTLQLISKSGGFGDPELLEELDAMLR